MQSQKKRDQFAISIRRKQITQKMQAMRTMLHSTTQINYQKYYPIIQQIQSGSKKINQCFQQLKILSFNSEGAKLMFKSAIHHKLYEYLQKNITTIKASQYNDTLTILINLCVYVQLDISNIAMQAVVASIIKLDKQMISLWFVANIIYQKSGYSAILAQQLVEKCEVIQFMQKRIKQKFQHLGDVVIFNFFCCSFLTVSSCIPPKNLKTIFKVIQEILKFEQKYEQNLWFLSEALADHGQHIGASEYAFFESQLNKKFELLCKSKKTKFVKNYLLMLIGFTSTDILAYQMILKYQIFTVLNYCLQNRFPQIKKSLAEIGFNLLLKFGDKVDIQNITFFQQLILEVLNLQKYALQIQLAILRYSNKFFIISAQNMIKKQSKQKFINQILMSNTINILSTVLINSNGNVELISLILHLLTLFSKIDQNKNILKRCVQERVPQYLSQISTNNQAFYYQISQFLQLFS